MKRAIIRRFILFTTTFVAAAAALAAHAAAGTPQGAQTQAPGRLRLESLERLAPKAEETVNIDIDGILIKFAGSILSDENADERAVKEFVAGLKGVYVRSYEFKSDGQFTDADVSAVREQLRAPAWSRIMDVNSRGVDFGNAEVYVATTGGRVEGMTLILAEPRELTVINIVGDVDLDKIKKIDSDLRLPRIHIKRKRRTED